MANQAWQIRSPGDLYLQTLPPLPKPGRTQVLVRIHAVSLNYRDKLVVAHDPSYPGPHKTNLIPCSDGAGVVEQAGPDSMWKEGDCVVLHANSWMRGDDPKDFQIDEVLGGGSVDGMLRRRVVVDDERLLRAPKGLSMEEASTLYVAGVTAYRALFYAGLQAGPGMKVLTMGTGGVSCYAIMIAAVMGATVVATSSSDEKLKVAEKLGATHLVNYRDTPDWPSKVLEATGGKGVDLAVDVVGAQSIEETLKCTAFGGTVCVVGILSQDPMKPVNVMLPIMYNAYRIIGQIGAGSKETAEEFIRFVEKHQLHLPIMKTFDFEDADKAIASLNSLNGAGKVVVRC